MSKRKLIVTHHSPDLDAIGAVWILKRFNAQEYADAKIAFINPGERITKQEAAQYDAGLHEVTHVDTGLGKFDHHQPERAQENTSAAKLTYEYVCQVHPDLKDDKALKRVVEFITEIDHFQEIHWPEADHLRYVFMIHELIRGHEMSPNHNDESQLHFGLECLNNAYYAMGQTIKANEIIREEGRNFSLGQISCLGIETGNSDTVKQAQKQGYGLVVRKDPGQGHIRIKVRPDADIILKSLYEKIKEVDDEGSWYYHPAGKMLLNGSQKKHDLVPSPLSLKQVIKLIKDTYGQNSKS